MPPESPTSISQYFGGVSDPRTGQNVQHPLLNIITIAICGIICGADTWVDIEMSGNAKSRWLGTFLDLRHGIPSHDTFGRVFRYINPEEFQASFQEWTTAICERTEGEVMAVDGKWVRRSKDGTLGKEAIQMVSIWASENESVLAQEKVDEGTNEITTIPRLLQLFDLEGGVVTVDAIGCQTAIAEAIIDQRADYVLAVKDNQGTLRHDIASIFEQFPPFIQPDYHKTVNKGHGRIEIRECWAVSHPDVLAYLTDYKEWKSLQSIVKVVAERRIGNEMTLSIRFPGEILIESVPSVNWALECDQ